MHRKFNNLERILPSKGRAGRPPEEASVKLALRWREPGTKKVFFSCVMAPNGCEFLLAGNVQIPAILSHAENGCSYMTPELRAFASENLSSNALSEHKGLKRSPSAAKLVQSDKPKKKKVPALKGQCMSAVFLLSVANAFFTATLDLDFTNTYKQQLNAKVNFAVLKLICCRGLVPHIIDSPEWKEAWSAGQKDCTIAPAKAFTSLYIPREAAKIRKLTISSLRSQPAGTITLTFDGTSTRAQSSVYSVHATTKMREAFFVEAINGTKESHTGVWCADRVLKVNQIQSICVKLN